MKKRLSILLGITALLFSCSEDYEAGKWLENQSGTTQANVDSSLEVMSTMADDYVSKMMDSLQIVGLNYMVLKDNELVHQKSLGFANLQLQVPMSSKHSFPVASISKLFSSTALLVLLEKKERSVNETVGAFLPDRTDLPESWGELTLKQLLSHTSGIPDQIDYQVYLAPESREFVIDAMKDKPFSSEPGTASKYNATGFLLVQMVIEELADQDFESYMQEQYFDKLGLITAKYGGFKEVVENRVTCYHDIGRGLEMFPLNYSSPMYAGAGLNISIGDLKTWFLAVQNEGIVAPKTLDSMWMPVTLENGEYGGFGLGWEAYVLPEDYRIVGHGGAGISSFRHYWNERSGENVTVILLTNGAENWRVSPAQMNAAIAMFYLED